MAQPVEKRKQSLYFPEEMLREIQEEATRQDRSLSWIMQQAWRSARPQIAKMPGMEDLRAARERVATHLSDSAVGDSRARDPSRGYGRVHPTP